MIAQGGATLTDRVDDDSLERPTVAGHFDYLVLQARGGDIMGAQMSQLEAQERAESSAATLVRTAREHGMKPVLLGRFERCASVAKRRVRVSVTPAVRRHRPVGSSGGREHA
jgi:hypothetical protein